MKTGARIIVGLLGLGLIAGFVIQSMSLSKLITAADKIDFSDVKFEVAGLNDINMTAALPIMQVFLGKAAIVEQFALPQASAEAVGNLNMTLPPGWQIGTDGAGNQTAWQTANTTAVQVVDQDGNSAYISKTTAADPATLLSTTTDQITTALEASGMTLNSYTTVLSNGQEVQAIDVQTDALAIQVRAWTVGDAVYLVALSADPANLSISQSIFESLS